MPSRLEQITIDVHETLADPSVERLFGRNAKAQNVGARRIVWIPAGGRVVDPRQSGGRNPDDGTPYRIQSCRDRLARVQAHIYAESYEAAELLLDNLIAAVCLTLSTVTFERDYEETSQEVASESGVTKRTELIKVTFETRLPVADEVKPLRIVEDVQLQQYGTIQDDGSIQQHEG